MSEELNINSFVDIDELAEEVERELSGEVGEEHITEETITETARISYETFKLTEPVRMANRAFAEFIFRLKFGQYEGLLTRQEVEDYVHRIEDTEFFTATLYALYYYLAPKMPALEKAMNSPALIPLMKAVSLGSTLGAIEEEIKGAVGMYDNRDDSRSN